MAPLALIAHILEISARHLELGGCIKLISSNDRISIYYRASWHVLVFLGLVPPTFMVPKSLVFYHHYYDAPLQDTHTVAVYDKLI